VTDEPATEGRELVPDTIVAQATTPGVSALAVVRLSGGEALRILSQLGNEAAPRPRRATLYPIHDPDGELIDRAVVTVFAAPESYTGEDVVEISCHGGWIVPARVLEACLALGAREAEPGEFTRRAVLHGKMDLIQAEGVADLIEGRSRALQRVAVGQVERGLSRRISELREDLVKLEAFLMHHIDFPEEDEAPVPLDRITEEGGVVLQGLETLAATAPEGELLREGALTVLAGPPNSGKSSLFNALVGRDRAIVTEIPGTTRDALEAVVQVGGFPFRLVDTAGIRETDETVERMGIEVAERFLGEAELVLYCVEAGRELDEADRAFLAGLAERPVLLLRTRADESPAGEERDEGGGKEDGPPSIRVSTVSGEGLDRVRTELPALVYSGLVRIGSDVPVLTRERQERAVSTAADSLRAFLEALSGGVPAEMASTHLRPAETALEELLGVISTDDVLDRVFSEFCVGK